MACPFERGADPWAVALELSERLFNQGSFFEAHEYLEGFWMRETGERREALQGLIQVAAGFHKLATGGRSGAAYLLERASERLERSGKVLPAALLRRYKRRIRERTLPTILPAPRGKGR